MSEGMQQPKQDRMADPKQMDDSTEEETRRPMGDNMTHSMDKRPDDPMKRDQDRATDSDEEMKEPMTHEMDAHNDSSLRSRASYTAVRYWPHLVLSEFGSEAESLTL